MPLVPLAPDVWSVEGHHLDGPAPFPLRCVVVRLADGGLWVHSPVAFTGDEVDALEVLGPVTHLVAPNALHHLHLPAAAARWPDAQVWGPRALAAKQPRLAFEVLPEESPWEGLALVHLRGNRFCDERVFFHGDTGVLVCTDLAFHLTRSDSALLRWTMWLLGAWGRPAQSALWRLTTTDAAALGRALQRLDDLPVTQVVMAHGEPVLGAEPSRALLTRLAPWARRRAARTPLL